MHHMPPSPLPPPTPTCVTGLKLTSSSVSAPATNTKDSGATYSTQTRHGAIRGCQGPGLKLIRATARAPSRATWRAPHPWWDQSMSGAQQQKGKGLKV